jgi:uncharacterized membrane protein YgaE (UPF0421/DUF939 family)
MSDARGLLGRVRTSRDRTLALARDVVHTFRNEGFVAAQAGIATVVAWTIAAKVLHNGAPVFAPTIALGAVVASQGERLKRTFQLIAGVVVGIGVGEVFIISVGTGYWQVGVSVVLAVGLAILVKGGSTVMYQAGSTAVLISTLPARAHVEYPRFLNSIIGAVVGIVVVALFLPLNPFQAVRRSASPVLSCLADRLAGACQALQARDADAAQRELDGLRSIGAPLQQLQERIQAAREAVSLAPVQWRRRQVFEQIAYAVEHMDRTVDSVQQLIRREVTLIRDGEPVPDCLEESVGRFAEAVRVLNHEFGRGRPPVEARKTLCDAIGAAGKAYSQGVGFSGGVVVGQLRAAGSDLLQATGLSNEEAIRLVREAVGEYADDRAGSRPPSR